MIRDAEVQIGNSGLVPSTIDPRAQMGGISEAKNQVTLDCQSQPAAPPTREGHL
jgi:hypothetical protein